MSSILGDAIKNARESKGLSQDALASTLGISTKTLYRYEKGDKEPTIGTLRAIAKACNIDIITLIRENNNTPNTNNCNKVNEHTEKYGYLEKNLKNKTKITTNEKLYTVDKISLKASAGYGKENYEIETVEKVSLPKILFKTPKKEDDLKIIEVEGDSMEPTIKDGSFVLIDTSKSDPIDGIYAILIDSEILIKRLQFNLNGSIKIISDNSRYESMCYNPKENTDIFFRIIGKKLFTIQ